MDMNCPKKCLHDLECLVNLVFLEEHMSTYFGTNLNRNFPRKLLHVKLKDAICKNWHLAEFLIKLNKGQHINKKTGNCS